MFFRGHSYISGEGANEVRFYPALALLLGRVSMSSFPCALSGSEAPGQLRGLDCAVRNCTSFGGMPCYPPALNEVPLRAQTSEMGT
jgi:hypothetical protein